MRRLAFVLLISGLGLLVTGVAVIAGSAHPTSFQMPPADTAYVGYESCVKCHTEATTHWNADYHSPPAAEGEIASLDRDLGPGPESEGERYGPACASCHAPRTATNRPAALPGASAHSFRILVPADAVEDAPETCTTCHTLEHSATPLPESFSFAIQSLPASTRE